MMQDFVRTSTYQKAILSNLADFRDKVILDVGAGSGILSFFAQQAGAAKVSNHFSPTEVAYRRIGVQSRARV